MITGSIVALVTPMHANGDIDWISLEKLVEWHITSGTNAIVAMGTTGESATLGVNEHLAVMEKIIALVAKRIPVIAGTGANSTREAVELTLAAQKMGADAALIVTPYYNKPTQEGLYLHHKAIADNCSIPQILYNVPGRTACDMQADTVVRLSLLDNIVAIKEATGNVERGREIRERCADDFLLYSGDDETFLELFAVGAVGNISVTANVAPELMSKVCKLALEGDMTAAESENTALEPLHTSLFLEANPIPVKWALHTMGKMSAGIRLPLTPLSVEYRTTVEAALLAANVSTDAG
ncbi:MAG: 4-hydroxy-tetrahydrodipicolinate synthase [Sinobacterium sp.]|nr:4-hydroxy-tetrahydrodipicolinate synthase [Sinobacterium sp.]